MKTVPFMLLSLSIFPFFCRANFLKPPVSASTQRCLKPIVLLRHKNSHLFFYPLSTVASDHAIFVGYKKNKLKIFTLKCYLPLRIELAFFDLKKSINQQRSMLMRSLRGTQPNAKYSLPCLVNVLLSFNFKNIPWAARLGGPETTIFSYFSSSEHVSRTQFNFEGFKKNIISHLIRIYVDDYFSELKNNAVSDDEEEAQFFKEWTSHKKKTSNPDFVAKKVSILAKNWMKEYIFPPLSLEDLEQNGKAASCAVQEQVASLFGGPLLETRIVLRKIELLCPTGLTSSPPADKRLHDEILKALSSPEFLNFFKRENFNEPPSQDDLKKFLEEGYFVKNFPASKEALQENTLRIQLCLKSLLKFLSLNGEKRKKRHVLPKAPPSLQPTVEEDAYPSVIIEELFDKSCIEARNHLSFGDVLNQVGKTLCNPVSTMGEESQVVDAWNRGDVCPSEEEVRKLKRILGEVDFVVSAFLTILPGAAALRVSQFIVGPSLQLLGETMNGGSVPTEQVKNLALNVIQEALAKKTGRLASLASAGIFYGSIGEEVREVVQEYRRDGQLSDDSKLALGNTAFLIFLQATFRATAKRFKDDTYNAVIKKTLSKADKNALKNRTAQTNPPFISLPEIAIENGQAYIELEMGDPPVTERRMIDSHLKIVDENGEEVSVYWNKLSRRWKIFSSNMSVSGYKMVKEFAALPVAPAEAEIFLNGQENEIEVLLSDGSKKVVTAIELYGEIVPFYRDAKNRPHIFSAHQMFENLKKVAYIDGQWEVLEIQENIFREFDGFQKFSILETDYVPPSKEHTETADDGIFTSTKTQDYYIRLEKGLLPVKIFNTRPPIFSFKKNPKQLFSTVYLEGISALPFFHLKNFEFSFDSENNFIKGLNFSDEVDISRNGQEEAHDLSIQFNHPFFESGVGQHYLFLEGKFFRIIRLKNKKQFVFKKIGSPIFEIFEKSESTKNSWVLKQVGGAGIVLDQKSSSLLEKFGIQPSQVELKDLEFDTTRNLYVHNPANSAAINSSKFFIKTDDDNFYEIESHSSKGPQASSFRFKGWPNADSIEFFISSQPSEKPYLKFKARVQKMFSLQEEPAIKVSFDKSVLTLSRKKNIPSYLSILRPGANAQKFEFLLNPKGAAEAGSEKALRKTRNGEIYEFDDKTEIKKYRASTVEGHLSHVGDAIDEVHKFNRFHRKRLAQLAFRRNVEEDSLEVCAIFPKVRGERLSDIFSTCLTAEHALFDYESIKVNAQKLIDDFHQRCRESDLILTPSFSLDDVVLDFSNGKAELNIFNFEEIEFQKSPPTSKNNIDFWSDYHSKVKEIGESTHYKEFREEWGIQPDDSVTLELESCSVGRGKRAPGFSNPRLFSCVGKMGKRKMRVEKIDQAVPKPKFNSLEDEKAWMLQKAEDEKEKLEKNGRSGMAGTVRELTEDEKSTLPDDQREFFLIKEYCDQGDSIENKIYELYNYKEKNMQTLLNSETFSNRTLFRFSTVNNNLIQAQNAAEIMNLIYGKGSAFVRLTSFKYNPEIFQVQLRMKKIAGKSLNDWSFELKDGKLSNADVIKLKNVMKNLDKEVIRLGKLLQDKKVIHRDRHSGNILLDLESGQLNLIDFDIAKITTNGDFSSQSEDLKEIITGFKRKIEFHLNTQTSHI